MAKPLIKVWLEESSKKSLNKQFEQLSTNFPKSKVRAAAKAGMKPLLQEAKRNAPVKDGHLKKGIISVEETAWKRKRKLKKAVYRLVFDRSMNEIFQNTKIENPGAYGGENDTGYYPVAQEYGFKTRYGYKKGLDFIGKAIDEKAGESTKAVEEHMSKSIDKLLKKGR